ncbi:MAG: methionine synthase [Oscillospiraceae bacterium]|nr:methionine synthase [Oscillospiraceae bacterium]MCI9308712.1 methionine synthase [Oscillospiraceae bacterium]MCI9549344.1 methionine synthase [Oscillospiraceae bacterium]
MELNVSEALRYLGVRGAPDPPLLSQLSAAADRLARAAPPRWVWRAYPLAFGPEGPALEGAGLALPGEMAARMLGGCAQAAVLICTLGAAFEALLRAEQARGMARAALLDACGSAWVEAGCDEAQAEISARFPGLHPTDRFSPGYGDLPLSLQRDICGALDAPRRLGVQVTDSLLLNPSKTVTAVIGLSDRPQPARIRGCAYCDLRENCQYRKGGTTCGA